MDPHIEAFTAHLAGVRAASPLTVKAYAEDLAQFAEFARARGVESPGGVTADLLRAFLADLATEKALARTTLARKASSLRAFFRYLVRRGVVAHSPAGNLTTGKRPKPLPKFLSEDAVAAQRDAR